MLQRFVLSHGVGVLLDLGHFNIASSILGFDKKQSVRDLCASWEKDIIEIHLSENDGKSDSHGFPPIDGWMIQCVKENNLTDRPICLEVRGSSFTSVSEHYKLIHNQLYGSQ